MLIFYVRRTVSEIFGSENWEDFRGRPLASWHCFSETGPAARGPCDGRASRFCSFQLKHYTTVQTLHTTLHIIHQLFRVAFLKLCESGVIEVKLWLVPYDAELP